MMLPRQRGAASYMKPPRTEPSAGTVAAVTVRVDLAGLLALAEAHGWASVPFVFVPDEPATADEVLERVDRAAVPAAEAAEQRHPEDPMWCAWLDASPKGVEGELQDGPMTPEEIEAWFTDFRDALEREG